MDLDTVVKSVGGSDEVLETLKLTGMITVRAVANLQIDPGVPMTAADFTTAVVNLQVLAGRSPISSADQTVLPVVWAMCKGAQVRANAASLAGTPEDFRIASSLVVGDSSPPAPPADQAEFVTRDAMGLLVQKDWALRSDRTRTRTWPAPAPESSSAYKEILKLEHDTNESLVGKSLQAIEAARKKSWTRRFALIADRARAAYEGRGLVLPLLLQIAMATSNSADANDLFRMVVATSAWRTIKQHVYMFHRVETFAYERGDDRDTVFPMACSTIVKYLMCLRTRGLKPSVPGAVKASALWVSRKLMLPVDGIVDQPFLTALSSAVVEAKTLSMKSKQVLTVSVLMSLEKFVFDAPPVQSAVGGLFLLMAMACLRFDDVLHVATELVVLVAGAVMGVSWQTKVDRARAGTKWAATRGSFSGVDWVSRWYIHFKASLVGRPPAALDYVLEAPTADWTGYQRGVPLEYPQANQLYKELMSNLGFTPDQYLRGIHHLRSFLVTMCAHAGASTSALRLMGHWRTDTMPALYTAYTAEIPLQMARKVVNQAREGWRPQYEATQSTERPRSRKVLALDPAFFEVPLDDGTDEDVERRVQEAARGALDATIAELRRGPAGPPSAGEPNSSSSQDAPEMPGQGPRAPHCPGSADGGVSAKSLRRRPHSGKYRADEISDSDLSDNDVDGTTAMTLFQAKSNTSQNKLHIQNELLPEAVACGRKGMSIQSMKEVTFDDDELAGLSTDRVCGACVRARPNKFPDEIVRVHMTRPK